MINTYQISTLLGKIKNHLLFLSSDERDEFNNIGYSGETRREIKMTREEYLNSLNKGHFKIDQLKYDNGDFQEKFLITHVTDENNHLSPMENSQSILVKFVKEYNIARLMEDGDGNDELRGITMEDINGFIRRNKLS